MLSLGVFVWKVLQGFIIISRLEVLAVMHMLGLGHTPQAITISCAGSMFPYYCAISFAYSTFVDCTKAA